MSYCTYLINLALAVSDLNLWDKLTKKYTYRQIKVVLEILIMKNKRHGPVTLKGIGIVRWMKEKYDLNVVTIDDRRTDKMWPKHFHFYSMVNNEFPVRIIYSLYYTIRIKPHEQHSLNNMCTHFPLKWS